MKAIVDWDLCDGNGVCAVEAPEVFEMDDADELHVLKDQIDESDRAEVEMAIAVCPKRAISLRS